MEHSLHMRSDGWAELPDGSLAVIMKVATRVEGSTVVFQYASGPTGPSVRLEWNKGDKLQIFAAEVSRKMVTHGWAKRPDEAAVKAYNAKFAAMPASKPASAQEAAPAATDAPDKAETPPQAAPEPKPAKGGRKARAAKTGEADQPKGE